MTQEPPEATQGLRQKIEAANQEAVRRMCDAQPRWVAVERALDVVPGMTRQTILHAGPPTSYDRMCTPQQLAVRGALILEGLARDTEEADALARSGEIRIEPCHEHRTVGSMSGITSASMPMFVVRDEVFGNEVYCSVYESPERRRLAYGSFDDGVLTQLRWLIDVAGPAFDYAVRRRDGIDTRRIIARALTMGDECHSRNWATTALLAVELMPVWLDGGFERSKGEATARFLARSEQFFVNLSMATCKAMAVAAEGIEYSTIVTALARNGVELGIRVSGLPGQWFTGPAGRIEGLYFSGFSSEDALPDMGDSAITETVGLGAFSMAAAPAFEVVGGTLEKALSITREMNEVTAGNNHNFPIATLNGMGAPTGIDIRLVLEKGITPTIDTAIAHKDGLGQIGVGNTKAPMEAFQKALKAFGQRYLGEAPR